MYSYEIERPYTLTDEGQRKLFTIRSVADQAIKLAGCVRADKLMCVSGDSWQAMACIDRLVEIGELREVKSDYPAWQWRVFVSGKE